MGVEAEHITERMGVRALQYSLREEAAFISWGRSNKWPQDDSGHLTEINSLTALAARRLQSRCQQGCASSKGSGGELPPCLSPPLVTAGAPWLVSAPSQSLPLSSHGLVCD